MSFNTRALQFEEASSNVATFITWSLHERLYFAKCKNPREALHISSIEWTEVEVQA